MINTATGASNTLPQLQPCRCREFMNDWSWTGQAVTLDCPQHGRVTIDRRISSASFSLNTPPSLVGPGYFPAKADLACQSGQNRGA